MQNTKHAQREPHSDCQPGSRNPDCCYYFSRRPPGQAALGPVQVLALASLSHWVPCPHTLVYSQGHAQGQIAEDYIRATAIGHIGNAHVHS